MRVRIALEIQNDDYKAVESIPAIEALFDGAITADTVATAQKLVAEALERHTRRHKTFDGLNHYQPQKETP